VRRAATDEGLLTDARGFLFDTNVLLLFVVGMTDPQLVSRCGRTKAFGRDDVKKLGGLLSQCPKPRLVFTPHVVAETWNLLENSLRGCVRDLDRIAVTFKAYVSNGKESWLEAKDVVEDNRFRRLGVTDTCLLKLARKKVVVITADAELAVALGQAKRPVINFTHYQFPEP
jgi:hypothetical protein